MAIGVFETFPKKLIIGAGAFKTIGEHIKKYNKKNIIIVTDNGMKDLQMIKDAVVMVESEGYTVSLFTDIGPNPTDVMVRGLVAKMNEVKPEIIVAIGGGSPIDSAKAANVVYTHGGDVSEYDVAVGGIEKITDKLLPLIAVPTTAGTGTEVTFAAVVTDTVKNIKYGIVSPLLLSTMAVLDPELTLTLPPAVTANTGMDVMTHAIEAYVSNAKFPLAKSMAIYATKMVAQNLKTAVNDGKNVEARENMLVASMMAGSAFAFNNLGVCHQIAHQLGPFCGMAHGLANAIVLPYSLRYNLDVCADDYAELAQAVGIDTNNISKREAAEKLIQFIADFSAELNVPKYLDDAGVDKSLVPAMAKVAAVDNVGCHTNPRQSSVEDIEQLMYSCFRN